MTLRDFASYIKGGRINDPENFLRIFRHELFSGEEGIRRAVGERNFNAEWLYRLLPGGVKVRREWLLYSPSKDACFCVACWLFLETSRVVVQSISSFVSPKGFSNWRKLNPRVHDHEESTVHRTC